MSDLQEVGASVAIVYKNLKLGSSNLSVYTKQLAVYLSSLTAHIEGTAQSEYSQVVVALNAANDSLRNAILQLDNSISVAQQWAESRLGSMQAFPIVADMPSAIPVQNDTEHVGLGTASSQDTSDTVHQSNHTSADNQTNALSNLPLITGTHSIEQDLQMVNPNYSGSDDEWSNNCQRCVSAYEARRRGYDVQASPLLDDSDPLQIMRHPCGWPTVYKDFDLIDCSGNSGTGAKLNVEDVVKDWDDNARGIIRVRWQGGGGHVFIVEKENGTIRFIDPQNGQSDAGNYFNMAKGHGVFCMRTDNLEFTERIHQCCTQRNGGEGL